LISSTLGRRLTLMCRRSVRATLEEAHAIRLSQTHASVYERTRSIRDACRDRQAPSWRRGAEWLLKTT
jgi:hypothetical protein